MKLGVVIVTYNRLELLKECINACSNQEEKFNKIIVINNDSTDGTTPFLKQLNEKNIEVINTGVNLGGAGGFYKGIEKAMEYDLDYLLLIDDDAILDKSYNKEILKHMEKENNICAYSGTVKTNNEIQTEHRRHLKKNFKCINSDLDEYSKEYFDYELSTFCGLYIKMNIIRKIGLPEKDFFIWFDDTEYSLRICKYSKIRNVNSTFLNHKTKIANSTGFNWKSYYSLRNQIVILKKYYSKRILSKFVLKMRFMILFGKVFAILKKDEYYNKVSQIYKDALNDGLNDKLGKNEKYTFSFKIEKGVDRK